MKRYGKFRGQVISAVDPEKRNRVLVKVPSLGNMELGWAESCLPPGNIALPKRGDYIWVEFEEGELYRPVWVGMIQVHK